MKVKETTLKYYIKDGRVNILIAKAICSLRLPKMNVFEFVEGMRKHLKGVIGDKLFACTESIVSITADGDTGVIVEHVYSAISEYCNSGHSSIEGLSFKSVPHLIEIGNGVSSANYLFVGKDVIKDINGNGSLIRYTPYPKYIDNTDNTPNRLLDLIYVDGGLPNDVCPLIAPNARDVMGTVMGAGTILLSSKGEVNHDRLDNTILKIYLLSMEDMAKDPIVEMAGVEVAVDFPSLYSMFDKSIKVVLGNHLHHSHECKCNDFPSRTVQFFNKELKPC